MFVLVLILQLDLAACMLDSVNFTRFLMSRKSQTVTAIYLTVSCRPQLLTDITQTCHSPLHIHITPSPTISAVADVGTSTGSCRVIHTPFAGRRYPPTAMRCQPTTAAAAAAARLPVGGEVDAILQPLDDVTGSIERIRTLGIKLTSIAE